MNVVISILIVVISFSNSSSLHRVPLYKDDERQNTDVNKEFEEIRKPRDSDSLEKLAVSLIKYRDAEYYGVISLGTPEQTFCVLLATGSPYFWIPSKKCSWFRTACYFHHHYVSSKSSTYRETGKIFYIDRVSSGFISEDTLKIGNVIVTNQTFGEAEYPPYLGNYDGVLGLAFPSRTTSGTPPLTSIISKGLLKNNIFSLFLDKHKKENVAGKIIFGDWEEDKFDKDSVNYIPLADNTAWIFDLDYVKTYDGEQLCYLCQALVDTGTALIVGHKDVVRKLHKKIGATIHGTEASVDCSEIDKLPPITFSINKRNYTIQGHDYVVKRKHLYFFDRCMIGIVGSETNLYMPWILGNIFLQQFYTIFDADNKRIAFADLM